MKTKFLHHVLRSSALLLLAAGAALPRTAAADPAEPVLKPAFACDERVFDFGSAVATGTVQHAFAYRNDGQLDLVISDVRASCGCTVAKARSTTVPPGGEGSIDVTFNLAGRVGYQTKTITVTCNDPEQPTLLLTLKGTVIKPVWATPAALYLGRIANPDTRHASFTIESDRPIHIVSCTAEGLTPPAVEYIGEAPGSNGTRHSFDVAFQPPAAEGPFNGRILVTTDDERQPRVDIAYTGYWAIPVRSHTP